MGVSGHQCEKWILLLSAVSSFGHGTSRTEQVTRKEGHKNDKKVVFAKLWKARRVWISLCKMKGNTKGNKTQFFQYVTDGYEEEDDQLFFLFATGRTRNLMWVFFFHMGQ